MRAPSKPGNEIKPQDLRVLYAILLLSRLLGGCGIVKGYRLAGCGIVDGYVLGGCGIVEGYILAGISFYGLLCKSHSQRERHQEREEH